MLADVAADRPAPENSWWKAPAIIDVPVAAEQRASRCMGEIGEETAAARAKG